MSRPRKIVRSILVAISALFVFFVGHTIWSNTTVGSSHFQVTSERIPSEFTGFKIAQISDLHNVQFGEDNSKVINILKKEKPNIIAITGDLVDSNHLDMDTAMEFVYQATDIAPCYYVTGNHEGWIGPTYNTLEEKLTEAGVTVLRNNGVLLREGEAHIQLIGLNDPVFSIGSHVSKTDALASELHNMKLESGFTILLSHRPEAFDEYTKYDIHLVLAGHAHGGQIRIPFVGGLKAPGQGIFPKYDAGEYRKNDTTMIVSRGIGNSVFPVRINNQPEVVIVQLKSTQ